MSFLTLLSPRVWLFLGIMLLAGFGLWKFGSWQYDRGAASVQAEWDRAKVAHREAEEQAIAQRLKDNEADAQKYKAALAAQKKRYTDEIADIKRRAGELVDSGLFLPETVCGGGGSAGAPPSGGSQGSHAAPAGTVALPDATARDLRALMAVADTIVAACRQLQGFISENGLEEP